jgi:hypothetical protein
VAERQYSRQELVRIMRQTGYGELADEAERVLPDPVGIGQLETFANSHGVNREEFTSAMGGSP